MDERPKLARRRAKGARPYFFDDPTSDKLLAMVMALAGEVSVLSDRLDSVMRVAAERGSLDLDAVENYMPSAEVRVERDARRADFLDHVLRIVHAELEATDEDVPERYRATVQELATD